MLRPLKSARPLRLRQRHAGKRRTAIGTADCPFRNGGPDPFPRRGCKRRPAVFFYLFRCCANLCEPTDAVQAPANPPSCRHSSGIISRAARQPAPDLPCAALERSSAPATAEYRRTSRISHAPHPKGATRQRPLNTAGPAPDLPCAALERGGSPATAEYRRTGRISHAPRSNRAARARLRSPRQGCADR